MHLRRIVTASVMTIAVVGAARPALASLRDSLHRFLSNTSTPTTADVAEPISPIVQRVAVRGTDFPVTSTTPGFTYRYDPELGMFARSSKSLGPEFLERAETIGRGRADVGMSYLYADLTDFEGENLADEILFGTQGSRDGLDFAGAFGGRDFSLQSHVFSFFATYGITDRWDVNLVMPLVYTKLELDGRAGYVVGDQTVVRDVSLSDFYDDDAFGQGDLQLRTKYRFVEGGAVDVAGAFALRLPTGDEDEFHGLGDVMLTPALVLSKMLGPHQVHTQVGVEVNADDLERSRARYGLGGELQVNEMLALTVEIMGSSSFVDDEFDVSTRGSIVPPIGLTGSRFVKRVGTDSITARVPRSDVVDGAVGFKINIAGNAVGYLGAIVPITEDSLRADFLPVGGFEVSF